MTPPTGTPRSRWLHLYWRCTERLDGLNVRTDPRRRALMVCLRCARLAQLSVSLFEASDGKANYYERSFATWVGRRSLKSDEDAAFAVPTFSRRSTE